MGANASGKTSVAKTFNYIQNFLSGRTIPQSIPLIGEAQYIKDENFGFEVLFYTDGMIYLVDVLFDTENLISEKWKKYKVTETTPNSLIRKKFAEEPYIYSYVKEGETITSTIEGEKSVYEHKSSFLSFKKYVDDRKRIINNNRFYYTFSGKQFGSNFKVEDVDVDFFSKIIKSFDGSINKVFKSKDNESTLVIEFTNGHQERITKGKLSEQSILSSGTEEAVYLASALYSISKIDAKEEAVFFFDEQMAFSHADMEEVIIKLIMQWIDEKHVQVFITSHNQTLLDIGLPVFNYTLLKKNDENNNIEVINPENEVVHQSRSIKTLVEKDIFSTSPKIEMLLELIK